MVNFLDMYSEAQSRPTLDSQQDIVQTSGSVTNGVLTAQFSRTLLAQEAVNDKGMEQYCVTFLFPVAGGPMNGDALARHPITGAGRPQVKRNFLSIPALWCRGLPD